MKAAFKDYIKELGDGTFPAKEHEYKIDEDVLQEILTEE